MSIKQTGDDTARLNVGPVNATLMVLRGSKPAAAHEHATDEIWITFDDGLEVSIDRSPGFPEGVSIRGWHNEEHVTTTHLTPVQEGD